MRYVIVFAVALSVFCGGALAGRHKVTATCITHDGTEVTIRLRRDAVVETPDGWTVTPPGGAPFVALTCAVER